MVTNNYTVYTRSELLRIQGCQQQVVKPLSSSTWRTLCELSLTTRGPTSRGCRGGAHKQRKIRTIVGNRPTYTHEPLTISKNNLKCLPREHSVCVSSQPLDFCLLNVRSVNRKGDQLVDFITENDLDIVALTETWLSPDDAVACGDMTPEGYTLHQEPRAHGKCGGGVAIVCKSNLSVKRAPRVKAKTFESISTLVSSGTKSAHLVVIYRPLSTSLAEFLAEFSSMLDDLALENANLLLAGDFNFHLDNMASPGTQRLLDILTSNNPSQHVHGPTHRGGHTLDLLITRSSETTATDVQTCDPGLSDHRAVRCSMHIINPRVFWVGTTREREKST